MHGNGIHVSFERFTEFEQALSEYTGAPYVVLTDCCTHAIELCLRLKKPGPCWIPYRSYLSVPMTFHKLGIPYYLDTNVEWTGEYRIAPSNIWDSARRFERGMYRAGALQCLSFGYSKTLEIGHGGAILTSNKEVFLNEEDVIFKVECGSFSPRELSLEDRKTIMFQIKSSSQIKFSTSVQTSS